ncbi:DUF3906 family protein [Paenibacillus spongiae]|uniref:DUF3906 family protein n=1 Tax=Paenibacillus spongiae TaxID=2909671 RepID=A0ABY5SDC3_9BACL|nr:DUF3906 family protein [Paenibacillus spongiae]UVI31936.1 DUF3906 family protein [Paenibacillus spongiae]
MFLYKIELELTDQTAYLILLAPSDEMAFEYVDSHVARHFIKSPEIRSAAIVEKKRTEAGSGYVIAQ